MNRAIEVILRPAQLAEAPSMAAMSRDLIEVGLAWRYRTAQLVAMMRDADAIVLVACSAASDLYGFAVMTFAQDSAHLALLCVHPAQQRGGIATRLLEWLIKSADVAGIASIDLESRADNAPALDFYQRMAFQRTQCIDDYYGPGLSAHRMTRTLRLPTG